MKRTIDTLSAKGAIPFPQAEEKAYAEFHLGGYWLENQQTKELIAEIEKAGIPALLSIPPWPRDTGCRCNRRA